jgi:hypothetical protein
LKIERFYGVDLFSISCDQKLIRLLIFISFLFYLKVQNLLMMRFLYFLLILTTSCNGQPVDQSGYFEGKLIAAEDSGYPFYIISVQPAKKKEIQYFTVDLSVLPNIELPDLLALVNQRIAIEFDTKEYNTLLDIRKDGISLLGMTDEDLPKEYLTITGNLSGTYTYEGGDLPGTVTIYDPHEEKVTFEFFVTPEMVEAESQIVTGYYEKRIATEIKSLKRL